MPKNRQEFRHNYYYSGAPRKAPVAFPAEPPEVQRKPKRAAVWVFVFVTVLMAVIGFKTLLPSLQSKAHGAGLAAIGFVRQPPINETPMAAQINQIINNSSLEVGVSIVDITNNRHYQYGLGSTDYEAASTTKLLSAALFLHDVEQGQASLKQPLGRSTAQAEMQKMIVVSDDDAWVDFNGLLGHPALLQYARSLGMDSYDPDTNNIDPDDLTLLLAKLYQRKLLNTQHTNLLLAYMTKADYPEYIGGVIPKGVKFYHKIGYLDDRIMDTAIIDNGHRPYALVVFTKDPSGTGYDQTAGLQVFHDITGATLKAFAH